MEPRGPEVSVKADHKRGERGPVQRDPVFQAIEIRHPVDVRNGVQRALEAEIVRTATSGQDVIPGPAVERVVTAVADDAVRDSVAHTAPVLRTRHNEIFNVSGKL